MEMSRGEGSLIGEYDPISQRSWPTTSSTRRFPPNAHPPHPQHHALSTYTTGSTSSSTAEGLPGPSRHYAFPPTAGEIPSDVSRSHHLPLPSSPSISTLLEPRGLTASSNRPRRASPLLHEIQPPTRRLSPHQVQLLTPFGGHVPPAALLGTSTTGETSPGAGMTRGSSSMGRSSAQTSNYHRTSTSMAAGPSFAGSSSMPLARNTAPRIRHRSLMTQSMGHSPLASAPMATIPSGSDRESSSGASSSVPSREASHQDLDPERVPSLVGGMPGTVPMTRSNSLPVLTLREMQALQEKDGELGIARGGGWAWISNQAENNIPEEDSEPFDAAPLSHNTFPSTNTTRQASSRPTSIPFTAFNDPFASSYTPSSSSSMSRQGPNVPSSHTQPSATIPGYHYSPTYNDSRRMSEVSTVPHSPARTVGRRPSAPAQPATSRRSTVVIPKTTPPHPIANSLGPSPRGSTGATQPAAASGVEGTSPRRPRITRYKSLPGRSEGLGLEIVFRSSGGSGSGASTAGPDSRQSEASGSTSAARRPSNKPRSSGTWTAIDVVDSWAATDFTPSATSSLSSARNSLASVSPQSLRRGHQENVFLVEEINSRAHLAEFGGVGGKGKARERTESVDSAMPTPVMGAYVAQLTQSGWNATFPRRGSLAVMSRTALGAWATNANSAGLGVGDKDRMGIPQHWSDRRGSWAEGWSKP